jgi:DNA-binding CsgD family transcriptional regulator
MAEPDVPPSAIASLSPKELEILHLLAMGHTGKSIAARLGQSETSINERLRDARRKTGVSSSRELARIIDAQKIWDKNIDLSSSRSSTEEAAHSAKRGLTSRGFVMIVVPLAAAVAAIGMTVGGSSQNQQSSQTAEASAKSKIPIVGRWSLDVSRIPTGERPRSVILDFRVSADQQWTGQSVIVAADGSRQHAEATGPADGTPVPVTGNMTFADEVSMRQPAPNTLVLTFMKGGNPVSTRVYTIEQDGISMKETISWAGDVKPRMVTTYFRRIG